MNMFSATVDPVHVGWMSEPLELIELIEVLILGQVDDMASAIFDLKRKIWGRIDAFISDATAQKSEGKDGEQSSDNSHLAHRIIAQVETIQSTKEATMTVYTIHDTGRECAVGYPASIECDAQSNEGYKDPGEFTVLALPLLLE
uniref:Uncharacterized protein n=1 Tax=Trichuris muris TaxID=70415 RepID=A0A5S6QJ93_TRIMR